MATTRPQPCCLHVGHRGLAHAHDGHQVQVERGRVRVRGSVDAVVARRRAARVGDQDVDLTERVACRARRTPRPSGRARRRPPTARSRARSARPRPAPARRPGRQITTWAPSAASAAAAPKPSPADAAATAARFPRRIPRSMALEGSAIGCRGPDGRRPPRRYSWTCTPTPTGTTTSTSPSPTRCSSGPRPATSASSAADTPGCGPRSSRRSATPPGSSSSREARWAGRRLGATADSCESSLTHGAETAARRGPTTCRSRATRAGEPRRDRGGERPLRLDCEFERTGGLAAPPRAPGRVAAGWHEPRPSPPARGRPVAGRGERAGLRRLPHLPRGGSGAARLRHRCIPAGSRRSSARPPSRSACGSTSAPKCTTSKRRRRVSRRRSGRVRSRRGRTGDERCPAAAGAHEPLIGPVYDYVLMTEPLTNAQLAAIGWRTGRASATSATSSTTTGSRRTTASCSAATTRSTTTARKVPRSTRHARRRGRAQRATSSPPSRSSRASQFTTAGPGRSTRARRFCAFFGAARGRVAYAAGFTGLGVGATRFAGEVMLDLLDGAANERTEPGDGAQASAAVPARARRSIGINATRWSLDRADHTGQAQRALRSLDAFGLGFDS